MSEMDATQSLLERFRFAGTEVDFSEMPTTVDGLYKSKKDYRGQMRRKRERLQKLQWQLYVKSSQGIVVILQGLDTSGKDGLIRHVLGAFNPQGCRVYSFGSPNSEEVAHDFLWRTTRYLPERGHISVFNRSHYEEVLVVRVHPEFLEAQKVDPSSVEDGSIWGIRFEAIRAHERHLLASGTRVVKLMLNVSKKEQRKRLMSRLTDSAKNWKFKESDIEERAYREDHLAAYEACILATGSPAAPWYVVPADDKRSARLLAADILIDLLESMDLRPPETTPERAAELARLEKRLLLNGDGAGSE
jgi:PPK2 family polyphosphate:nucleotide phosphotransferase